MRDELLRHQDELNGECGGEAQYRAQLEDGLAELRGDNERLTRERNESSAEATRLRGYNEGLAKIGAELEADNERLRTALKPFADYAEQVTTGTVNWLPDPCPMRPTPDSGNASGRSPTVGDVRRAAAALRNEQQAREKK